MYVKYILRDMYESSCTRTAIHFTSKTDTYVRHDVTKKYGGI